MKNNKYIGSIVLGLNDALVEITGVLAGLTFALQNTRIIALAGLITGIAASLSMAASEYLSNKSEKTTKKPIKAGLYTGAAYIATVILLILPFFIFANVFVSLSITIVISILIILFFSYYVSITQEIKFKRHFFEMVLLSLGIAIISFIIGYFIRKFFSIDI
jgi:VIT1/CCC1 family predicted Fe2+/Mn2+ transporter